jgi:ATP-dependent nuclease, subunit B
MTGPLALGSRIHNALEASYKRGEDLLEAHEALVDNDKALMLAQWGESVDFTGIEKEAELGRVMLEGFIEWAAEEGIDSGYDIVSAEETLAMPLLDGRVELRGKIDIRVRRKADGMLLFRDWKTSANFNDFLDTAHMSEQIMTYMTLEAYHNPDPATRARGGVFVLIRKVKRGPTSKPPYYMEAEVRHNDFTMRSFWKRLHGEVTLIMATKDALDAGADHKQVAYPHFTGDCKWKCPFVNFCPMFDDGSAVEDALATEFHVGDPNERYASPSVPPV